VKKALCLAALAVGLVGMSAGTARGHRVLGMDVPRQLHAAGTPSGSGQLIYHGGPVMHANTTYAIYWIPPGYTAQAGYSTLIDQYFTDVAADSGLTTNVNYTATQYHDGAGNVRYRSSFGGSYTDTAPLPASRCTDSYTAVCLSAVQIRAEIQRTIAKTGWATGPSSAFFLFTAKGVGSCDGSDCAFSKICGYHAVIGTGSSEILYANIPYADTVRSRCDGGQHPNSNEADATINTTSHEHSEMITDPRGTAWYDSSHSEDGDKCAGIFGPLSGTTAGGKWNQTINGHHYFTQEEYSNRDRGCVQTGL